MTLRKEIIDKIKKSHPIGWEKIVAAAKKGELFSQYELLDEVVRYNKIHGKTPTILKLSIKFKTKTRTVEKKLDKLEKEGKIKYTAPKTSRAKRKNYKIAK